MPGKIRINVLLGSALRSARLAAGITQESLAFQANLDRTYISHLENGHKSPTVDVLFRISTALGISAAQLITQVEQSLENRRR
jgi:transcriptional regulator with XRE-family HTH domain